LSKIGRGRVIRIRLFSQIVCLLTLGGIAVASAAHAVTAPEPSAIERTIPIQLPQGAAAPRYAISAPAPATAASDHRRFTLGAVNIDGATIFSEQQLSRYFEPYLATEVDGADLAKMALAITNQYHRTGYLLSYATVPTQNVEAGMVRLSVVEGRISNVTIQGAGSAEGAVEAIAAPLVRDGPLKSEELERAIGLIRDFPGFKVTDVALVRSDITGSYTLKLSMAPDRARGFSYFDNRGTGSIGRSRFYNSLTLSSLALPGDELRLDLFAMPGSHQQYLYGQAMAAVPLGRQGLRLSITGSRGNQYLQAGEHFNGQSDNVSLQLSYPFRRSRALTLLGKVSIADWRTVGTRAGSRELRDRLGVARLGLEFSNEATTRFQGELTLSRGLGFGAMTHVGDPLASRQDASGKFTKLAATLQVSRPLSEKLTLRTIVMAQYSDRPLLSAEEFSLGGNRVGRAFSFNALTGDRGAGGGVEVSYRVGASQKNPAGVELFGFADGGFTSEVKSAIASSRARSLASVGPGARFTLARTSVSVEAGVPVAGNNGHHSPRLFVSLFRAF
jgi:hemolysin activation/secretion protein